MKIIVLASGSKGNATYIETESAKILIDAGISYKQLKTRFQERHLTLDKLDAILVTHEHSDHIGHLATVAKSTKATVYIHEKSFNTLSKIDQMQFKYCFIEADTIYKIKDLNFVPIIASHDAKNTFGYLFKTDKHTACYLTDTGVVNKKYLPILKTIELLIIESNHDVDMLLNSNRIFTLKQRILSPYGHLSNVECANLLKDVVSSKTKHVILAHLSEDCNTPEAAYNASYEICKAKNVKLSIANQHEATELFDLETAWLQF